MKTSIRQSMRLINLGFTILIRKRPLGIGLKNECWGGVAATIAKNNELKVTDYYGLSFTDFKLDIMKNNRTNPSIRNIVMGLESIKLAFKVLNRNMRLNVKRFGVDSVS